MNVSPVSFKNAVKIYDTYENAKAVSKIVNSNTEDYVESRLKSVFPDRFLGEAMAYKNNKGQIYILSGSESACVKDAMSAIKKHMNTSSKEEQKVQAKYYGKIDSLIAENSRQQLWVDWDKSQTKIKSFSLMG